MIRYFKYYHGNTVFAEVTNQTEEDTKELDKYGFSFAYVSVYKRDLYIMPQNLDVEEFVRSHDVLIKCCDTCKRKMRLDKYDYSIGGCKHTRYDGFACLAFIDEGLVIHMTGTGPANDICEMYEEKRE